MTTELNQGRVSEELTPRTITQPMDDIGTILVYEMVTRVPPVLPMKTVERRRLWGVIVPVAGGMFQATDTDGNDVGEPMPDLQGAVDNLFLPVR